VTGGIISLVMAVNKMNEFEALRYVMKVAPQKDIAIDIEKNLSATEDFVEFDPEVIKRLHDSLGGAGLEYMKQRGFTQETLDYFNIGYSLIQNMVTVPIYNHLGVPVGMVGRAMEKKAFKNTNGLPGTKVFFNLNNAKRYSAAIITEAAFDAMMIDQAGFPGAIATLGGYVSAFKMDMLNRYFNTLIIATDKDAAGLKLGEQLQDGFIGNVLWATPLFTEKDACAMSEEDLKYAIDNAMSPIEKEMHDIIEKAKSQP
jgi:DNA primase